MKTNHLRLLAAILLGVLLLSGCAAKGTEEKRLETGDGAVAKKPALPSSLRLNGDGIPEVRVYLTDEETVNTLDAETYLMGVLAGEMKNDWPLEALKAQAILARTFLMKFCSEKKSRYPGADISTDVEEAQAYDFTGVNERIERAVTETKGLVLSWNGEFPYAWFHAHSGGMTARAKEGLDYEKEEPGYTQAVRGLDSREAPAETQAWEATFSADEMIRAAKKAGLGEIDSLNSISVGERGESGRAVTLLINGQAVSAPEIRLALGGTKIRSTLLTSLRFSDGRVTMAGKGYGHGVGMPQWGAYALAEEGKSAQEIVTYYFRDVTVQKLW